MKPTIIRITRDIDNNIAFSGDVLRDCASMNELAQMFICYDDVSVHVVDQWTESGSVIKILEVLNNITQTNLTRDEICEAYYQAFCPATIKV